MGLVLISVVVPSLTPGSYNENVVDPFGKRVVVPSLTPGSYNDTSLRSVGVQVVVPSLTPGSYNAVWIWVVW